MSVADASVDVRMDFLRKTYSLFLAGILMAIVAGIVCLNVQAVFSLAATIWRMPILAIGLILGGSIGAQAVSRVEGLNYAALFGFTALIGFLFAPILLIYGGPIVTQAGVLSAIIFGALTAYVFVTKKDFSFMGGMLFVGMVALILGGLVNAFFFKNSGMGYWMAWGSLLLSSGFVLYTTSTMLHDYDSKGYVSAALSLFVSFFNIFMSLLRILGGNRD
jgi:FtsH-binding integral membrane protein